MKLSTKISFNHSLIAPKGYKFVATEQQLHTIFGSDTEVKIKMKGSVVSWVETHWNMSGDFDEKDWVQVCKEILVKEED